MADVLNGNFKACESYAKYDLRQQIYHDDKSEVISTHLDPYFEDLPLLCGEETLISLIVQILHMEGWKHRGKQ